MSQMCREKPGAFTCMAQVALKGYPGRKGLILVLNDLREETSLSKSNTDYISF